VTTFVALGDSITLGIGDRGPTRAWRGWVPLLAEGLCEPRLHNLAASGAQSADIEHDQLPRALELRPDVASVIMGINDTLRSSFDPRRIARSAEHTVGALRSAGAEVLTIRLPDPGFMLGLPSALARPLARRIHAVNTVMDDVADRFGTLVFDAAGDLRPADVERGPDAPQRARAPPDRRTVPRSAGRDRPAAGAPAGGRAVQPATDPAGPGRLDGHQGHRLGHQAVHRHGAVPAVHGAARAVGDRTVRPS
jgi:lysophospholipase L1-like esterase